MLDAGLIRKSELMNAIWKYQPGLLLYALGVEDRELEGSPEYMISMTDGIGTDFTGFWK